MAIAHVRKGDTVVVVAGKERGKRGRVLRVIPDKNRVVVERINMIKKHQRPTQKLRQGGIIEREGAIHLSNVMLVDPTSRQTHPDWHARAGRRQESACRPQIRRNHRQGVTAMADDKKADKSPKAPKGPKPAQGGKAPGGGGRARGAQAARRPSRRWSSAPRSAARSRRGCGTASGPR